MAEVVVLCLARYLDNEGAQQRQCEACGKELTGR
jgi:hypothetical protein